MPAITPSAWLRTSSPTSVRLFDTTLPAPDGSDSGISSTDLITNVLEPYIDGISEVSNFGDLVTINLLDESPTITVNDPKLRDFGMIVGSGTTNQLGQFVHFDSTTGTFQPGVQIVDSGQDPTFNANIDPNFTSINSTAVGDKIIGIRATDSSKAASGNMTLFELPRST